MTTSTMEHPHDEQSHLDLQEQQLEPSIAATANPQQVQGLIHQSAAQTPAFDTTHQLTSAQHEVPSEFICSILGTVLTCPVTSSVTGLHYECSALSLWTINFGDFCPRTGQNLGDLTLNLGLLMRIIVWLQQRAAAIRHEQQQEQEQWQQQQRLRDTLSRLHSDHTSPPKTKRRRTERHSESNDDQAKRKPLDAKVMDVYSQITTELIKAHTQFRIEEKAKADEMERRRTQRRAKRSVRRRRRQQQQSPQRRRRRQHYCIFRSGPRLFAPTPFAASASTVSTSTPATLALTVAALSSGQVPGTAATRA